METRFYTLLKKIFFDFSILGYFFFIKKIYRTAEIGRTPLKGEVITVLSTFENVFVVKKPIKSPHLDIAGGDELNSLFALLSTEF